MVSALLVEAGRYITPATVPVHVRSRRPGRAYLDPHNIWGGPTAHMGAPLGNADNRMPRRYEQGHILARRCYPLSGRAISGGTSRW
jgi:5-(hydroxymethyl)furfural/furfural oxidase